jgi:hypothetical protein
MPRKKIGIALTQTSIRVIEEFMHCRPDITTYSAAVNEILRLKNCSLRMRIYRKLRREKKFSEAVASQLGQTKMTEVLA